MTADAYFQELQWYDQVLRDNPSVIGAKIFTPDIPNWQNLEIEGPACDQLVSYLSSQ